MEHIFISHFIASDQTCVGEQICRRYILTSTTGLNCNWNHRQLKLINGEDGGLTDNSNMIHILQQRHKRNLLHFIEIV